MEWHELARFWSKVEVGEFAECWNWRAGLNDKSYGRANFGGQEVKAHRASYQIACGEIPEGKLVLHKCDNPSCVNPRHLFIGDHQDNYRDMVAKGRTNWMHGNKHPKAKLTPEDIDVIRKSNLKGVELAKRYGVCPSTISEVRNYRKYK